MNDEKVVGAEKKKINKKQVPNKSKKASKKANKYIKFWEKIKNKQENQKNNIIESYKQSLNDS